MKKLLAILPLLAVVGCAGYRWTSTVPADMRTVSVPTFRNESGIPELGSTATRQLLREFQREGTMKIADAGASALEIQGVIMSATRSPLTYNRSEDMRLRECRFAVVAKVTLIDKRRGTLLIDNREYRVDSTMLVGQGDVMTAQHDASGRIAEELAQRIVDDVLDFNYSKEEAEHE